MNSLQTNNFYQFSGFRLDAKKRRLLYGDEIVPLTPKEFDVLFFLIQNTKRVVEKEELLAHIWKDTFVEEGTLTRNVSWLRKKLAAHGAGDMKIIETLPKRGYRFLPEIFVDENALVVEEQTIQHIEIEEVIEIEPSVSEISTSRNYSSVTFSDGIKALPAAPAKKAFSPLYAVFILLILGAAFVVYQNYSSPKQTKVILASEIHPFSGLPGRENTPAFSPDGKQMVFSWDAGVEGGNLDVYVKLIDVGEPIRLTRSETDEIKPVFSPDGKSIAFVRVFPTHNEIILIPALGGAERKIYEKASYASISFSPDGKYLAFAELDLSNNAAGIFTINLQSSEKTRLTNPETPAVDHTPRFSPDGKNLAFIRYFTSFHREIFVVSASGGEPRQITSDAVRIYGLAWNIDNESLFFTSFRAVKQLNLWKISLSEAGEPQMIATNGKNLQDLAIAPDGKTVAFVEESVDENIWEIAPNAAPHPLIRSIRADHSQQLSPDGTKIVFASDRTGNYEIWSADADGKNQQQLTDSHGSAGSPRFSPDGKFVAYDVQIANGSAIFITSINDGRTRRLIEEDQNASLPAWSIDGNWIFFNSNRSGTEQIWKIPASGGAPEQLTKQGAFEIFAAPDGQTVIYSKGAGKMGLWSIRTNGTEEKPIAELSDAGAWRAWSVTSQGVYYLPFSLQTPIRLKFFESANRQTRDVIDIKKLPLNYYSNLCLTPDGKKILYAQQDQSASTIMLAKLLPN